MGTVDFQIWWMAKGIELVPLTSKHGGLGHGCASGRRKACGRAMEGRMGWEHGSMGAWERVRERVSRSGYVWVSWVSGGWESCNQCAGAVSNVLKVSNGREGA